MIKNGINTNTKEITRLNLYTNYYSIEDTSIDLHIAQMQDLYTLPKVLNITLGKWTNINYYTIVDIAKLIVKGVQVSIDNIYCSADYNYSVLPFYVKLVDKGTKKYLHKTILTKYKKYASKYSTDTLYLHNKDNSKRAYLNTIVPIKTNFDYKSTLTQADIYNVANNKKYLQATNKYYTIYNNSVEQIVYNIIYSLVLNGFTIYNDIDNVVAQVKSKIEFDHEMKIQHHYKKIFDTFNIAYIEQLIYKGFLYGFDYTPYNYNIDNNIYTRHFLLTDRYYNKYSTIYSRELKNDYSIKSVNNYQMLVELYEYVTSLDKYIEDGTLELADILRLDYIYCDKCHTIHSIHYNCTEDTDNEPIPLHILNR